MGEFGNMGVAPLGATRGFHFCPSPRFRIAESDHRPTTYHSNNTLAKIGTHCNCHQGWIPLLFPIPDEVVHPLVRRG